MTVSGIFSKARKFLNDEDAPLRWDDAELRENLIFGIRELHKIRPETRYPDGKLVDCVTLPDSDSASISLDDRYEECLTYYVVYLCYLDDDSDTVNAQLAENYLAKFNTKAQL